MLVLYVLYSYIALFDYQPRKSDELELVKGELYGVVERGIDGWLRGFRVGTNQSGVFPGNYVQETTPTAVNPIVVEGNSSVHESNDPGMDSNGPPPLGPKPNQSIPQSSRVHSTSPISNTVYAGPRPVSAIGGISGGHNEWNQMSFQAKSQTASSSSGTLNETQSTQLSPQWPQV